MLGGSAFYDIGPFRLDPSARLLSHEGQPLPLGPRAVAVLSVLVEAAGEPLTKERILEAAWPGLVVEEANLAVQIAAIRKILGRAQGAVHWIETLPRRGYRFAGPVLKGSDPKDADGDAAALSAPDHPSIAVLPFVNMSGDPSQDYFADGVVEEIITALGRIRWLFVIARTSSFSYKGKAVRVQQIARELGVRYIVEGSIRRSADQLRITAQLIDAATGAHLWADHFEGSIQDVFALQDQLALAVAGVIEPELIEAEIRHAREAPTRDITAYELYLRALQLAYPWERTGILAAGTVAADLSDTRQLLRPHGADRRRARNAQQVAVDHERHRAAAATLGLARSGSDGVLSFRPDAGCWPNREFFRLLMLGGH